MSDLLKFIIQELNKAPFNKNYSVVTFDALQGRQLLRLLNDILSEIDPKQKVDIDEEDPGMTAMRILNVLSIFKYPMDMNNMEQFQQRLNGGDKAIIHPLLEWLLQRLPELKKRSYLAKFLVKLDIPQEFLGDVDVNEMYQQYIGLIEQFKECHKQCEQLRNASLSTSEVKRDIENMEEEKKQLTKRVERIKKKVESFPNAISLLTVARSLRQEKERQEALNLQKQEQSIAIHHADQRLQRLTQNLRDLKQSRSDATPEVLVKRLEQEVKVNSYIVKEKLPKELKNRRQLVEDLQKVGEHGDMKKSDLDTLYAKIQTLNNNISKLVEKKMMSNEPMDDKLSMFRQQAAIIARKKESTAEMVNTLRNELNSLEKQANEKQTKLEELGGVEILKGDEFKQYVTKLRNKSNVYKKKRQEQSELQAEIGVLSRTNEILMQRFEQAEQMLADLEAEKGIVGFRKTQQDLEKVSTIKSELDEEKAQTLTDISEMVMQLNQEIQAKKSVLSPIIKELQPIRQEYQDLSATYEEKKTTYNSVAAGLEAKMSKLEREVKQLEDEVNAEDSRSHLLDAQLKIMYIQLEHAMAEMKNYLSGDAAILKKSLREQYTQCIQEQEKLSKVLKEEQKNIRENYQDHLAQMQMWKDLQRLLECKQKCAMKSRSIDTVYMQQVGSSSQTLSIQ